MPAKNNKRQTLKVRNDGTRRPILKFSKKSKSAIDALIKGASYSDYYEITARVPHPRKADISAPEGQLSVDVAETDSEIIIAAAIAGVKAEDIEIAVAKDMLTIRGKREEPLELKEDNFVLKECFWGPFSRTIILPHDIAPQEVRALFKNGILFVTMPKEQPGRPVPIMVVDE